jgi:hypothetical protein
MALQIINRKFVDYQNRELSFPFFQGWDSVFAKYTVQVDFSVQLSISNQLVVSGTTLSLTTGNWEEFGFFAGASVTGTYTHATGGAHTIPSGTTVDFVDGAIMTLILGSGSLSDGSASIGVITCDEIPNAFEVEFNLVPNTSGAENQFSLIDGEVNRFSVLTDGMGVSTPPIAFTRIGSNFSGGSVMNASIDRLADISGKQVFEIKIAFKNWTIKNLDQFLTANCVKPWIRIKVFPEYQNPTVSIDVTNTPSDAQTGAFNEVGNGGIPDYSVQSIAWQNSSSETLPTFDYSQPSKFTATINGVFTSRSVFNLAWYFDSVDDADYKNLPLPIDNNLMLVTKTEPLVVGSNANLVGFERADGSGLILSEILITQSGTSATISGIFTPNTEFTNFIESKENFNRNFRLAIRVENPNLTDNFIRPVWLDVDSQIMTKQIIPLGSYPQMLNYQLYGHDGTLNPRFLFIEDDFLATNTLLLPYSNDFTGITLGMIALNTVTGEKFILESSTCNLTDFPTLIDGTKPISKTINLPINLSPTNPHKTITWEREESLDSESGYGIRLSYSSVINWKYWEEQINANIFFFPNLNKDWLNFQSGDWGVFYAIQIDTQDGQYEDGYFQDLKNYNDWDGSTFWNYYKEDMTPITKPLIDEITIIKATHTNINSFDDSAYYWGQMTVEPNETNPRWDISSVYDTLPNPASPLIPLVGETRLKLIIDNTNMETWCRFDPTKLSDPSNVSFTSRIFNELLKEDNPAENRNKVTVKTVKLPKDTTNEPRLETGNCCDCVWDVFADANSSDSWKNHVSSRWATGETVTFQLYKDGILTAFQPTTQDFANDINSKYCTITWKEVLLNDGQGCYTLKASIEVAGLSFEKTLGVFNLLQFDWFLARKKVMIRSVFNDANMREQINFTNSNVIDCIMFDGDIEEFQPNTEISNLTFSDFSQNKVKRENLTSWSVNVNPSGYCLINRLVNVHLVGENKLFATDYRYDSFDKTILDKPCILSESPQMTPLYSSEKQKSTFKIQEKIVNNLTKYGSVTASGDVNAEQLLYPNTVTEGVGSVEAKVYNTNEDLIVIEIVTEADPNIVFPNTEVYLVDGNDDLISTTSAISGAVNTITAPNGLVTVRKSDLTVISNIDVASGGTNTVVVTDSVAVLKDSAGTTISSTNILAQNTQNITAPDGAITVNGSSVGSVKSNGSRALLVKLDGTNAGTYDGVNTINVTSNPSDAWVRPSGWLALDTVGAGTNNFSGLFAVYENQKNVATIQIAFPSGTRVINWGDGTATTASSATLYTKVYDYASLSSVILVDEFGFNYKMAVINIPMTSCTQLYIERNTTATLINNGRSLGWLDIALDCSTLTTLFVSINQGRCGLLQRLLTYNVGTVVDFQLAFCPNLRVLKFDFTKLSASASVSFANSFLNTRDENNNRLSLTNSVFNGNFNFFATSRIIELGNLNFSAMTSASAMFIQRGNLKRMGTCNFPLVTTLQNFQFENFALESIGTITTSGSLTSINNAFYDCKNVKSINITNCANVTTVGSAFLNCNSLESLILTGLTRGFTVDDCNMSATAINALFTSLGTASGAQTINVRRNPGSATCNTSIATAKGFTVVIA